MKYSIEIYCPMLSVWMKIAKLDFLPDEFLIDRIAEDTSEDKMIGYDSIRIKKGNKIIKEIL